MHTPIAFVYGVGASEILLICLVLGLYLVAFAIPAILAFTVLSRVPQSYRKQEPGLAFLLLIPIFALIWVFFVHPRVAQSLQGYYAAAGDTSAGDCGASIALALCICTVCSIIPLLGWLAGLAGLILLIVFYVKAFELSARIPRTA